MASSKALKEKCPLKYRVTYLHLLDFQLPVDGDVLQNVCRGGYTRNDPDGIRGDANEVLDEQKCKRPASDDNDELAPLFRVRAV